MSTPVVSSSTPPAPSIMPKILHANPIEHNPYPSDDSPSKNHKRTIIPTHTQCLIPFNDLHQQYNPQFTFLNLDPRMGRKLHSQTPQTPPIPSTKTTHVTISKKYPHQTVSFAFLTLFARRIFSSSKKDEELILDAGDFVSLLSSEEELGPVVGGWSVPFGSES
jgi:hypothetical protein